MVYGEPFGFSGFLMGENLMAFEFINQTDVIGRIMNSGTNTLTGSMVATLFFILLFMIVVAFVFGIPLEFTAIFILPFVLAVGSYYSNFYMPLVIIIVFVSSILAKNWLFK